MNAPSHWARVKLVAGNSGAAMWDLSSALPEARVTVGSGADAGWNVQAPGVQAVHFELYWDGKALWVGPPMAGTLAVNGQPVQSWRQLTGQCQLQFGGGAMAVETSGAQAVAAPAAPAPVAAPPAPAAPAAPVAPRAPAPTLTSQAALPIGSLDDFADDDATAIYEEGMVPPHSGGPSAPTPIGGVVAPPAGLAAPRLGTGVPSAPGGGRAAPPTVGFQMNDSTAKPVMGGRQEFKTQVLDPAAIGDVPPMAAPGAQALPPAVGPGGGAVVEQRPTLMQSSVATDIIPKDAGAAPPGDRMHVGPGGGSFALPPIPTGDELEEKKGLERPPQRTMILFAITLLVALGALTLQAIQKKRQRAAAEAAAVAEQERQAQEAQTIADNLRQRIRADRARVAQQQVAERERIMGVISADLETAREEAVDELGRRATEEERTAAIRVAEQKLIEKKAVDAAMTNQLEDALALYELLASDYPNPEYTAAAAVIRAKVECRRNVRRNGTECTP